jgi:hypothetical protein
VTSLGIELPGSGVSSAGFAGGESGGAFCVSAEDLTMYVQVQVHTEYISVGFDPGLGFRIWKFRRGDRERAAVLAS